MRFWEAMFRGEGLMDQVGIRYEMPLDDFRSLLAALHGRGQHIIIECEDRKTPEDDEFFIGRIIALDDEAVSIRYFDPIGRWDDKPCVIDYGDITKIQFDTPYISTLTKYLKDSPMENGRRWR